MTMLSRALTGTAAFAVATTLLVVGYQKGEPAIAAEGGGVRALGTVATDYIPMPPQVPTEQLTTESLAVEAVRDFFERHNCELRSVKCLRRMGADYCSICLDHLAEPRNMLAATLVRCRGDVCSRADDVGESERVGWNAEWACGRQYADLNEWNDE